LVERALAALPDGALAARDMFETADEYEHRVERARATISDMVFDAVEERHGAGRRENDAALYDVLVPMDDQGGYDIDRTRYAFTVMGAPAWLRLERDPARSLYRAWQDARVVATRYRTAGVSDYADFRLVHPTSGREYPLVLEQNPFTGERLDTARRFVPAIEVGPDIVLRALELNGIFPTLHARYAEEPLGRFVVENAGTGIVSDLEVSFEIDALTAPDRRVAIAPSIAAGQRIAVELTAPVSPSVLDSSEGGSATLSITVRYRRRDERYERTIVQEIRVLNRNAVRWDDDRRVAAFMNISSAGVLGWSGPVASAAEIDPTPILSRNLLYALQLFESLHAANVRYVVDPNSAYESLSDDRRAVDYLRFPAETIAFGAGDCDDLSVLLATLLESVGVETAYITTPGHILIAFDTGIPVDNALRTFERAEDLIIHDQRAWMPIETTILEEGFTRAWQVAALHWRQHRDAGSAGFFTTREAWSLYAPVAPVLPGTAGTPDIVSTRRRVAEEIDAFRALELEPKLTRARAGRQEQGSPQSRNRIGVLYATYGMPARAAEHFEIAADEGHVPAMVNLANVLSTQGRHDEARIRLESALAAEPENARVLLGLAFSHWESGNEQDARSHYEVASRLSPSLARRYPLFADQPGEAGPGGPAGTRAGVRSNLILTDWVDERTAE
ncbi:MAG: tetratricopeptide repeat protein, partial [Spirochaetota bacterium]